MSYDIDNCYDDGPGYDECYDVLDDIYAGTAVCDDGSDQAFEDRHEGEDVDGEMGVGDEPEVDPFDDGREPMDGYVD